MQSEIETHRDVYTSLNGTGRKLLSSLASQDDAVMLQRRLDEMNQRWHHLKAKSMAIRWVHCFFPFFSNSLIDTERNVKNFDNRTVSLCNLPFDYPPMYSLFCFHCFFPLYENIQEGFILLEFLYLHETWSLSRRFDLFFYLRMYVYIYFFFQLFTTSVLFVFICSIKGTCSLCFFLLFLLLLDETRNDWIRTHLLSIFTLVNFPSAIRKTSQPYYHTIFYSYGWYFGWFVIARMRWF